MRSVIILVLEILSILSGHIGGKFQSVEVRNEFISNILSVQANDISHSENDSVKRVDITDGDSFLTSFKPRDYMDNHSIKFTQVGELTGDIVFPVYYYRCEVSINNVSKQIFEIESSEILEAGYIEFIDMNFDGYLDMSIVYYSASANQNCDYYRYIPNNNVFEETPFFRANSIEIKAYPDTKQIIVTSRSSGYDYERTMYKYINNEYICMRREYAHSIDFDTMTYDLRIVQYTGDAQDVVYEISLTLDEYYGDTTIRDNYLLYGNNIAP